MKKELVKGNLISYKIVSDIPTAGSFEDLRNPVQTRINKFFLEKEYLNHCPYPVKDIEKIEIENAFILGGMA